MKKMKVNLDRKVSSSYEICIGYDVLDRFVMMIAKNQPASHYVIISDSNVSLLYGEVLAEKMRKAGVKVDAVTFPAGEESKNIEVMLALVRELLRMGTDRSSVILALGGGVVGDMAGFVASVFMRSLPYVQIPTTLMAQVDSRIGGKTAVDLPEGKNLLGAFYQPRGVYIDLKLLDTLPETEFNNGLVEVIKYGVIDDTGLFSFLEDNLETVRRRDRNALERIVESACRIKKGIVEIDEKEQGLRRVLNFGHTIGHAIEAESAYGISHGNAVSVGMVAAVTISEKLYNFPGEDRMRLERLMKRAGLPLHIPRSVATEGILSRLRIDKKKEGSTIHFVLLKKMGMPFINGGVPEGVLRETIEGLKK